jgi:MoaA/NifB/PqqE/SkfB family radical SAM enzyme
MPRGKNYKIPIENSCNVPYYTITVDSDSNCILCGCDGWLPIPVGKVDEFHSIKEVFDSPVAKMLQNDIDQKKFTWCAIEHCGIVYKNCLNDYLKTGYNLNINIDNSCNLACPSCRREIVTISSGSEYEKKIRDTDRILTWLEKFEHPINISLGGNGDALASLVCRNLIKNYNYRPTQRFFITTNGLLLKKVMPDSALMPAVFSYSISVDAGSKEVYENVRRPGKWNILLENLEWLANNKQNAIVTLNFVMQNENYQDLKSFVELCQKFGFNGQVQPLNNWGTWNDKPVLNPDAWTVVNGTYLDHNVIDSSHKNHKHFVETLNEVRKQNHRSISFSAFFNQFQ